MADPRPALTRRAAYRVLLGSRLRSQLSYRSSFWLDAIGAILIGVVEFSETYAILSRVTIFGGLDFPQAALVFAFGNLAFALADMFFGQLDAMAENLRLGRVEVLLVRPMPLLAQLIADDLQLRRLGRAAVSVAILLAVLPVLDVGWTPAKVYLLVITPLVGTAIFAALWTAAGGLQFFLINGAEFTNSFVYGGSYAAQVPGSVLFVPLRVFFTFVAPVTAVGYLPTLLIIGLPGPPYAPAWLGWCGPLFALLSWLLAALAWRTGTRHFVGAGG